MASRECNKCAAASNSSASSNSSSIFFNAVDKFARGVTQRIGSIMELVNAGADINQKNDKGRVAIHILADNNKWSAIADLVDFAKTLDVDIQDPEDPDKKTVLHKIVDWFPKNTRRDLFNYYDIVQVLCQQSKKPVLVGVLGWTPLHYAVKKKNAEAIYAFMRYNTYDMENIPDTMAFFGVRGRDMYAMLHELQLDRDVSKLNKAVSDGIRDKSADVERAKQKKTT